MSEPSASEEAAIIKLSDEEVERDQVQFLAALTEAFNQTPIDELLTNEAFEGKRELRGLRKNYLATSSPDVWQREIMIRAFQKASNRKVSGFVGEGIRFVIPRMGLTNQPRVIEHFNYTKNGESVSSAPANTSAARDNVAKMIIGIGKGI